VTRASRSTTAPVPRQRPAKPVIAGYVRTVLGQSPVPQINVLAQAGVAEEDIYVEQASGHKAVWPERDLLLSRLRRGDTLTITRFDRLFYSIQNLVVLGTDLRGRGIRLHAVEQGIDSESLEGRDLFGMLSALAGLHHDFVLAATHDGLASARAKGRSGGRPPKLNDDQNEQLRQLHAAGTPIPSLARKFDISRATVYRLLGLPDLDTRAAGNMNSDNPVDSHPSGNTK
jgi:DNA invertase Pin-like site-specific DNA recombinase